MRYGMACAHGRVRERKRHGIGPWNKWRQGAFLGQRATVPSFRGTQTAAFALSRAYSRVPPSSNRTINVSCKV